MNKETNHRIRLGIFVTTGIIFLIIALYFIGNNRNMFGSTFKLYSTFQNVNGLQPGNNVRYSGIDVGTVEKIEIINDTSVHVQMVVEEKLKEHIRRNSIASIGTDGLMGNKLVNIDPGTLDAPLIKENDEIPSMRSVNTEEMLRTLELTNQNIAIVSADLKDITRSVQKSHGTLYKVLMDTTLAEGMESTLNNIQSVSKDLSNITGELSSLVNSVKSGKGTVGMLLKDTVLPSNLQVTINNVKLSSQRIADLSVSMTDMIQKINGSKGTVNSLLYDSALVNNLKQSMQNIQAGTDNFNQNMEALKNSFLFRSYFRNLEKEKEKAAKKQK
ncbi:MAG: MlaD family protein [Bacteroidetes bacterium]|nr:MlaD family protein [Bacteroidota bacterium]